MKNENSRERITRGILIAIIGILFVVIVCLIVNRIKTGKAADSSVTSTDSSVSALDNVDTTVTVDRIESEGVTTEETVISSGVIQDGLNDMGVLITEEYYFTQVEEYSSTKTYLKLFKSESGFMFSYDGEVTAGLDFGEIEVSKDDENKRITVVAPKAELQQTSIDPDSFKKYSEKEGWGNSFSIDNYNEAVGELEKTAEANAIDRGILDRADEKAEEIITEFIRSLIDDDEYTIVYSTK